MDLTLRRLLGGIANGRDVPSDWDGISEWVVPGTDLKSIYEVRHFYQGDDRFNVWVAMDVPEAEFQAVMQWHREMYRGDLVAIQKEVLHESIVAATNYNNVIMLVGYAALFTLWAQMSGAEIGKFTPLTSLVVAIFLCLSVLAFVGWELFGMIRRSLVHIAIAKAVDDPLTFEARMRSHSEKMAEFARRFQPTWLAVVGAAVGFALIAFITMLSALLHGAWMAV